MAGAVGVHAVATRVALPASRPVWASRYWLPIRREIDPRLIAGAAVFGAAWGIAGYCPGPAIVSLVAPSTGLVTFVLAMAAGTLAVPLSRAALRLTKQTGIVRDEPVPPTVGVRRTAR